MSYNWNLPLRALLIGGPKHETVIPIDNHNLRTGYEVIETGDDVNAENWRSHRYTKAGHQLKNGTFIFLHESVGDPDTVKLREAVVDARNEIATASKRLAAHVEQVRNLHSEVETLRTENKRLKDRWQPAQENVNEAIRILTEAEWNLA